MPHTVESTITYSERDLARGAMDLSPEHDLPVNKTILDTAVTVIREAGPKIVEVMTSHLMPTLPRLPEVFIPSTVASHPNTTLGSVISGIPEVMVSSPIEAVVIFPVTNNSSNTLVTTPPDTVWYTILHMVF
jgi:hypothetical protein